MRNVKQNYKGYKKSQIKAVIEETKFEVKGKYYIHVNGKVDHGFGNDITVKNNYGYWETEEQAKQASA